MNPTYSPVAEEEALCDAFDASWMEEEELPTRQQWAKKPSQGALYGALLTLEQQYRVDLARFPRCTMEEEQALVERACQGDQQARDALILSAHGYISSVARRTLNKFLRAPRLEFLDLVQVGFEAALSKLEKALLQPCPSAYLRKCIRFAMHDYCIRFSHMIIPGRDHTGKVVLPPIPLVSLDQPLFETDDAFGLLDELVTETRLPDAEEESYDWLYEAVEQLEEKHQEVIKRHYGLGCAPESLYQMGMDYLQHQGRGWKGAGRYRSSSVPQEREASALEILKKKLSPKVLGTAPEPEFSALYYTAEEVAALLGLSSYHVRSCARQGRLMAIRQPEGVPYKWGFPKATIDALVADHDEQEASCAAD